MKKTEATPGLNHAGIWRHRRKDGTLSTRTSGGREFLSMPAGIFAYVKDVTNECESTKVGRSEDLFAKIFQSSPLGVTIQDR